MAKVEIMDRFLTDHEMGVARTMLTARGVKPADVDWMVTSCPGLEYVRKYYGRGSVDSHGRRR